MNEHGYCPNCNLDLDDGLIYESFLEKYQDESKMSDEELLKSAWGDYYKVKKRKQSGK